MTRPVHSPNEHARILGRCISRMPGAGERAEARAALAALLEAAQEQGKAGIGGEQSSPCAGEPTGDGSSAIVLPYPVCSCGHRYDSHRHHGPTGCYMGHCPCVEYSPAVPAVPLVDAGKDTGPRCTCQYGAITPKWYVSVKTCPIHSGEYAPTLAPDWWDVGRNELRAGKDTGGGGAVSTTRMGDVRVG